MPRTARQAPGGMVFHVINRGVGKQQLFFNDEDYLAFERVIQETLEKRPMRILSYCLMPNHWHLALWPENDGDLGKFMQRLTVTHVTRWQKNYNMVGYGHLYQGRAKKRGQVQLLTSWAGLVGFGHAQNGSPSARWNGFSRHQSWRRETAAVLQR